jgi:hypothetical protein
MMADVVVVIVVTSEEIFSFISCSFFSFFLISKLSSSKMLFTTKHLFVKKKQNRRDLFQIILGRHFISSSLYIIYINILSFTVISVKEKRSFDYSSCLVSLSISLLSFARLCSFSFSAYLKKNKQNLYIFNRR